MSNTLRVIVAVSASLMLSHVGCKVGPDHRQPAAEIQQDYRHTEESQVVQDWSELTYWWMHFDDESLNLLMDEAISQNLGLEEAALRVLEARFQRGIVRSNLWPQIDGDGGYTFQKTAISGGIFGQLGGGAGIDPTIDNWDMGFNMAWEVDVFGRLRRDVEAAEADICANVWDYRDVMIILMSDVATNYIDARTFQKRIAIAEENLVSQRETLRIRDAQEEFGRQSQLAVEQARTNVYSTEATIPTLKIGLQQSINRLSVLLGRPPGYVDQFLAIPADIEPNIPTVEQEVAIGIPAELLRRRPDIRRSERQLAAQTARIGVAEAELYPIFGINGTFGVNAQDFSELYRTESIASTIGPTVRWNILNFGRIRCNVRAQEARAEQIYLQYQASVLRAAEEVDNALTGYVREQERIDALSNAVKAARSAAELSTGREESGLDDPLAKLDADRLLLQFEDQLAVSQGSVALNLVQLYRALGGGWEAVDGQCVSGLNLPGMEGPAFPADEVPIEGAEQEMIPLDAAPTESVPADPTPIEQAPMLNTPGDSIDIDLQPLEVDWSNVPSTTQSTRAPHATLGSVQGSLLQGPFATQVSHAEAARTTATPSGQHDLRYAASASDVAALPRGESTAASVDRNNAAYGNATRPIQRRVAGARDFRYGEISPTSSTSRQ